MKAVFRSIILLASLLLLGGCSQLSQFITAPTPTWGPYDRVPAGAAMARSQLAQQFGVPLARITILNIQGSRWGDSCLGLEPAEGCAAGPIDGYTVKMYFEGVEYNYHTDLAGNYIRAVEKVTNPSQATLRAHQYLASLLNVPTEEIDIVSEMSVHFKDTCLDIGMPGNICSKYPTWGIRIIFVYQGHSFEFRTLNDTAQARLARVDDTDSYTPVMRLVKSGGPANACVDVAVFLSGIINVYDCKGASAEAPGLFYLKEVDYSFLIDKVLRFADFNLQANDPNGTRISLNYVGLGPDPAAESDKSAIREYVEKLHETYR